MLVAQRLAFSVQRQSPLIQRFSSSRRFSIMTQGSKAKIVTPDDLSACGARLREGKLVSFPTETVYGLGCHALDASAVHLVFLSKERPLTDPLIVHVNEAIEAFPLWNLTQQEHDVLSTLTSRFWPGPLTLVARAQTTKVPDCLMAGTGFVACRSPSHPLARALIQEAQVPLAAPSANKFGHVSPTTAQHVFDDLEEEDVWILDTPDTVCQVGVESTVAKLEDNVLTILRQGAVSEGDLRTALQDKFAASMSVQSKIHRATADTVANVAPGQSIRHYSPRLPSFLVSDTFKDSNEVEYQSMLASAVVIDFGGRLVRWHNSAKAYRDLSTQGSSIEAAQVLFDTLRWAERIDGASTVLFPVLPATTTDALALALKDRLTRAASGVIIHSLQDAKVDHKETIQ